MSDYIEVSFFTTIIVCSVILSWPIYKWISQYANIAIFIKGFMIFLSCLFMFLLTIILWPFNYLFGKIGLEEPMTLYLLIPILIAITFILRKIIVNICAIMDE